MCTVITTRLSVELLATDRLRKGTACTALHTKHEVSVAGPGYYSVNTESAHTKHEISVAGPGYYSVNTESARLLLLFSEITTIAPSS